MLAYRVLAAGASPESPKGPEGIELRVIRGVDQGRKLKAGRRLPLAGGEHAAQVDLLDLFRRQTRPLDGGGDRARAQGVRRKARERTLEDPDGRAHRAQNNDVVHDLSCEALGGEPAAGEPAGEPGARS